MAETQQAGAAVESKPGNNGTTATKPETTAPSAENTTQPVKESALLSRRRLKRLIPVVVLALAAIILFGISGGWSRWVGSGSQKTDDAILRADITPLSTRVSGTVAQVAVADYQRVKAGDLLVQLKDDDFKAQVAVGVNSGSDTFCRVAQDQFEMGPNELLRSWPLSSSYAAP